MTFIFCMAVAAAVVALLAARCFYCVHRVSAHRVIGDRYLMRWHIIPRNRLCNVYLHRYTGSDKNRDLHDHPWGSVSFLLSGELVEESPMPHGFLLWRKIRRFLPVFRRAKLAHRIVLLRGPAWTLFITGPAWRRWGFLTPDGWTDHATYNKNCKQAIKKEFYAQ